LYEGIKARNQQIVGILIPWLDQTIPNRTMQKKLRFSAGVTALSLVGLGLALGLASLTMEAGTTSHKRTVALGGIIIVVGGLLGLFAAIGNDGRISGLLAFGGLVLLTLWFFSNIIK